MNMIRNILSLWAGLVALVFSGGGWAGDTAPDELVRTTTDEVIAIIKSDKDIQQGHRSKTLDLIESKILPHFDFTRMTRLAVGKNWSKASPDQQKVLVQEFRTLLVRTYSTALTGYKDQKIEVKPVRMKPSDDDVTVRTLVKQSAGQPVEINYSLGKSAEGWKAYDVIVAGVSLVTNYRSTFDSEVRQSGIDGLIKALREKNESLEKEPAQKNAALGARLAA